MDSTRAARTRASPTSLAAAISWTSASTQSSGVWGVGGPLEEASCCCSLLLGPVPEGRQKHMIRARASLQLSLIRCVQFAPASSALPGVEPAFPSAERRSCPRRLMAASMLSPQSEITEKIVCGVRVGVRRRTERETTQSREEGAETLIPVPPSPGTARTGPGGWIARLERRWPPLRSGCSGPLLGY